MANATFAKMENFQQAMWLIPNIQNYTHILGDQKKKKKTMTPKVPINCTAIRIIIRRVTETWYLCFTCVSLKVNCTEIMKLIIYFDNLKNI
jgi:hypothetical protein